MTRSALLVALLASSLTHAAQTFEGQGLYVGEYEIAQLPGVKGGQTLSWSGEAAEGLFEFLREAGNPVETFRPTKDQEYGKMLEIKAAQLTCARFYTLPSKHSTHCTTHLPADLTAQNWGIIRTDLDTLDAALGGAGRAAERLARSPLTAKRASKTSMALVLKGDSAAALSEVYAGVRKAPLKCSPARAKAPVCSWSVDSRGKIVAQ